MEQNSKIFFQIFYIFLITLLLHMGQLLMPISRCLRIYSGPNMQTFTSLEGSQASTRSLHDLSI